MIQDKIFFDEKDPTGLSYNTPFTFYGSYQGRLWSKSPSGSIQYYTQNSDLSAYATTGSNQFSGSQTITGSLTVTGGVTGTATTASYVEYANIANRPALISGSAQIADFGYATTGSNGFNGSQSITGSLTVTGQVVAQTLNVQQVTSSIVYSSGSNIFGNSVSNTQQFTGSLQVSGSSHYLLGNLGIGTTSPDVFGRGDERNVGISIPGASDNLALALNAGGSAGRGAQIYMGQGGTRHFTLSSNATETRVGTATSTPLILTTNDTTRLTIAASTGAATFSSTTFSVAKFNSTYGQVNIDFQNSGTTFASIGSGVSVTSTAAADDTGIGTAGLNKNIVFATGASYLERMRITSAGNVGIGTNNPLGKLSISNAGSETIEFAPAVSTGNNRILSYNRGNSTYMNLTLDGNTHIFKTEDVERVRIDAAGNVGIGTTSIVNSISGTEKILEIANPNVASLYLNSTSTGKKYAIYSSAGGNLVTYDTTGGGATRLVLDTNGNFGVGYSSSNKFGVLDESAKPIRAYLGNANNQGRAQNYKIVRHIPVGSVGNKLIIPFTNQGNLNSNTIVKIMGHSARFNARIPLAFMAEFAVGHLSVMSDLVILRMVGNASSISIAGMTIEIDFSTAYTASEANGVYITIEYMTNEIAYSIIVPNIVLN